MWVRDQSLDESEGGVAKGPVRVRYGEKAEGKVENNPVAEIDAFNARQKCCQLILVGLIEASGGDNYA